ncbi:MAG: Holliday junction branch migration protein RuvA [Ruminiclostridium sp.]
MIYSVNGTVEVIEPNLAVIDCGGVGYACRTTANTISQLKIGEKAKLLTYLAIREDAAELFGFADTAELSCFKMLISVSGVGPKAALSILSGMTPQSFALCVASGDSKTLTNAPGIGKKTAERIVLELKDKVSKQDVAAGVKGSPIPVVVAASNTVAEAVSALMVLGYTNSEATNALSGLDPASPADELIKAGLKKLARF